jgi:isoleucyl-tRNA synthetase
VVTHGFVLDGKAQKMSKSLGNVITPEDIMKTLGADILRWWTASVDYNEDVRISKEILERAADAYRKIRNTLRFLLGALADFDPAADQVQDSELSPLDVWIQGAFSAMAAQVAGHYRNFQFMEAAQALHGFCQLELSGRYFEILKDRLYCDAPASPRRRSCRATIWKLAQGLATLLAPILSFTADEVWENIPGAQGSVFEQRFPEGASHPAPEAWERFWTIREAVQGAMEPHRAAKAIGTSLDAQVTLCLPDADLALLGGLGEEPQDLLVIGGLDLVAAPALDVAVAVHQGVKCPRCWNHKGGAGQGEDEALCPRCWDVMKGQA